jgi:hypothetical protein
MEKTLPNNQVRLCMDKLCIDAAGENAKLLTLGVYFLLLLTGLAIVMRAAS